MPLFVFDTDIWIRINRNHPPDIFVSLWDRLNTAVANGEICSPDEVFHELGQGTDDLAEQLNARQGLFVPLTADLQDAVTEMLAQCPSLFDPEADRHRADPFVVALAKLLGCVAVTNERRRRSPTGPMKIPDACDHFGIKHADWFSFLRMQGWRL